MSVKSHVSQGLNCRLPEARGSNAGLGGAVNLPSPDSNRTYVFESLIGKDIGILDRVPIELTQNEILSCGWSNVLLHSFVI